VIIVENPPGPAALKLNCPANMAALHDALDAIEQACSAWKIDSALVSRARIVVEELFSNTIKYGYGAECERPVRLHLQARPELTLTYEDDAPPFDPFAWKAKQVELLPLEDRPIGQAGIAMVLGLSAHASYQRSNGANCLTVIFAEKR
jgi:anti-sigma regulatory factor (Ser/Thr protein kinase)